MLTISLQFVRILYYNIIVYLFNVMFSLVSSRRIITWPIFFHNDSLKEAVVSMTVGNIVADGTTLSKTVVAEKLDKPCRASDPQLCDSNPNLGTPAATGPSCFTFPQVSYAPPNPSPSPHRVAMSHRKQSSTFAIQAQQTGMDHTHRYNY